MKWRRTAMVVAMAGIAAAAMPAQAERLITSLSNHRILVTSNFVGEDLVLFGAIEPDKDSRPRNGGYDIVVTVSGPRRTVVTRKKERRLGIWMNVESREFVGAPIYLAVLSNRPLDQIANEATRRRLQLGLARYSPLGRPVRRASPGTIHSAALSFASATGISLYQESAKAVTFLSPTLFRASISLPAGAPIGTLQCRPETVRRRPMIARANSAFEVVKAGFEQVVAEAAHQYPLPYGIATAIMALFTGWLASIIFRRD